MMYDIDPSDKFAHNNKGISLHKLGRYEEAIASYDRAIEIDPSFKDAHNSKGISLKNLGRDEEAIASYDRAIEIDPSDKFAHYNKGISLKNLGRYEEAIASYDRAIEIDPSLKEAHYSKGNSLDDLGRYEEAIASYDRAIEIDPSYKFAHCNKGSSLDDLGRYEEAIASYDRAIEIDPSLKEAHYNKGFSLKNLGRYEEAIASYDRAIEIDPSYTDAHNNKGRSLDDLGRYEEAIASYDRAIEIDPSYKDAHNNKGGLLYKLGRYEEAIASYDHAIEIDPSYKDAHNNKGGLLYKLGRYEEAIASYDRAIEIDPRDKDAHNGKGISLDDLGRYEEAIASYDRAIEIDPSFKDAYNNKGNSLQKLGRYEEAIASYDRAIEIDPNNALCFCNKGQTLQKLGRDLEALECFDKANDIINSKGFASSASQGNINFVKGVLSRDREDLLKKVIELQKASIETGELVGELDLTNAEEKKTADDFEVLKQEAAEITSEALGKLGSSDAGGGSKAGADAEQLAKLNAAVDKLHLFMQQKFSELQEGQGDIKQKVESIDVKMDEFASSLELSQKQIAEMVEDFKKEGIVDMNSILPFLSELKATITGTAPEHIAQDPYQNAFYNTLQRDLNATYIAAMSVQTEIVANSKKGQFLGKMGSILSVAGEYIPTLGGGVILLGAILSTVDQRQQDAMVKKFAAMANSVSQMEVVTSQIAQILTQDGFTGLLVVDDRSFNKKISDYLLSFLQEVSGAKNTKAAASSVAIDMMQKMGVSVAESSIKEQSSRSKISWLKSKISVSKKKAAAEQEKEGVQTSSSTYESQGDKDAYMVSAMIISKIYKGEISAGGSPDNIAKSAACAIFGHFDLSAGTIESLLSVSPTQIALMPAAAAVVDAETTEDAIAKDILTRIERQVSPTEEFRNAFMESMISRLKTITSQNDIKFIESLQLSFNFAEMFKAQAAEIFITKLKEDKSVIPNLKVMKVIFKEIETELRDEGQFKAIDNQILVWNAFLEYDNPFLDHPELLQSAQDLGIDTLKLINMGFEEPEIATGILNGVETHGAEFVLRSVFGGAGDGVPMTFDSSLDTTVVAGDVVESGCL